MSIATSSKAARRQIADEFKERKVPKGIFAIRCSANNGVWVGSSPNLNAAQNSIWFQLDAGRYRNSQLQDAWKRHGREAFTLEVLEHFSADISPLLLEETYTARKRHWTQELPAHIL